MNVMDREVLGEDNGCWCNQVFKRARGRGVERQACSPLNICWYLSFICEYMKKKTKSAAPVFRGAPEPN